MKRLIGAIYLLCATSMLLALAGSTGCAPNLSAQSVAPPGRTARLDEVRGFWGIQSYRIELSAGVALAVTCYQTGPCEELSVISDNPAIAEVRPASIGTLERNGMGTNQATSSGIVIVGKAPGTARLRLRTKDGKRDIAVTIIAPPQPTPAATVAR